MGGLQLKIMAAFIVVGNDKVAGMTLRVTEVR